MDEELLTEFLAETNESLAQLDNDLVNLEQTPDDPDLLARIFRLAHTIKGTCGFIGLPNLEAVAHATEDVLGKMRDGKIAISADLVTVILKAIDCIKHIVRTLEQTSAEPGDDNAALIAELKQCAAGDVPQSSHAAAPKSGPGTPFPVAAELDAEISAMQDTSDTGGMDLLDPDICLEFEEVGPESDADGITETVSGGNDFAAVVQKEEVFPEAAPEADIVSEAASAPAQATPPDPAPAQAPDPAPAKGLAPQQPAVAPLANQSIRVGLDVLETLMNMVGELVLTRNQLVQIIRDRDDAQLQAPMQRLTQVTSELQEGVMKTRMQPIANAWSTIPRLVRDISTDLGKKVRLELTGEDTELDRQVLEMMRDPLMHMVRNACDHGLETPDERTAAGKSETGTISLSATHKGGHIIITISDDGRGLSAAKIADKAVRSGMIDKHDAETLNPHQLNQLIFQAGFSTASEITNVSGRGVGMDVVRANIERIGGNVEVTSVEGEGTQFAVKIPLTLAIVNALIVDCAGERFAIPQIAVLELVRFSANSAHKPEFINDAPVLRLRERLLPLVSLRRVLDFEGGRDMNDAAGEQFVIVCQVGTFQYGILVDRVQDTEEIVVKPVAPILSDITMFSGNTILGDGSIVMILDPNGIASRISRTGDLGETGRRESDADAPGASSQNDRAAVLLFRSGAGAPKGVLLSLVARLEDLDVEALEMSDGGPVVQYRDQLMPILTIDEHASLPAQGRFPVIVFSDNNRSVGLAVDEIVDIVEERMTIELPSAADHGVIGTAVLAGRATEIIDVTYYLGHGLSGWIDRPDGAGSGSKRSLLLVDDSPFFRNLLTPLLTVAGYDVTCAESGDGAMQLCADGRSFDIIVSDIEMPGMSGFEFAETVQRDSVWKDTPMVAVSSFATPTDLARGRASGFVDYVAKFDRDALVTTLDTTLASRPPRQPAERGAA